eukprot:scaffold2612_cov267-Chaetoceros_neogracile.AAC.65
MEGHEHYLEDASKMNNFCQSMSGGGGMSMYMSGFRSTLLNPDAPCLNLLSPNWKLDSEFKFMVGMMAVICLGILLEAIPVWRLRYLTRLGRDGIERENKNPRLVLTAFHGSQALLGYILMLTAMTYSIELILSAIIGLSLGFYIFYKEKGSLPTNQSTSPSPCCEFLEEIEEDNLSAMYPLLIPDSGEEEHCNSLHQRTNAAYTEARGLS